MSRILVLTDSVRPLDRPCSIAARIDGVCATMLFCGFTNAGIDPLEAARQTDLGGYADLLDAERIVGNLHRAYAEVHGAAPGAQIDLTAALTDMVTFNNGQPLSCYA